MSNSLETNILTKLNIKVIGYILSTSFYNTKYLLINLVKHCPSLVNTCIIKGVLDIEWTRCLWKLNQSLGGLKHQDAVAVFINKTYIGNYLDFREYLISKYNLDINVRSLNYKQLVHAGVQNCYNNDKVTFVRMTFDVDNWEIGHVVFALFHKLVPKTCKYFIQLCTDKDKGYLNSPVHRIDIDNGFIQAGRNCNPMTYLMKENYLISHDRRGVLSLAGQHTYFNGPEFIINLRPNLWMNNKYVAFGHMIEGEKTLKTIEKLCVSHKTLNRKMRIASCDVLLDNTRPAVKTELNASLNSNCGKSDFKDMYINVYGRPELLHVPCITDLQYIRAIVKTVMKNVIRKIKHLPGSRKNMATSNRSRNSRHFISDSIPSVRPSSDTIIMENRVPGLDRTKVEKSKHSITICSVPTEKLHNINLPKNHKDYWKHKKIYKNIAG